MNAPIPTERQVQRSILDMMGKLFPSVLCHQSPNGGHLAGDRQARFKQVGALKGDGMKVGWPDLTCVWNRGVAFMEVKRPGWTASCVSEQQLQIHEKLADCGFKPAIVSSVEEARDFLLDRGAPCIGRKG